MSDYSPRPEKSMALVSAPSSECFWIKRDARLGHFIFEEVERGLPVSRQGSWLEFCGQDGPFLQRFPARL